MARQEAWPSRQVDGQSKRDLPHRQSGARPCHQGGARPGQGRQVPGHACRDPGQSRGLSRQLCTRDSHLVLRHLACRQFATPAIYVEVKGVFTNTAPVDAYRGAGRPEACYVVERLVDRAAREMQIDPVELRRRNFIANDAFPYTTPVALTYDSGDYSRRSTWCSRPPTTPASSTAARKRRRVASCAARHCLVSRLVPWRPR